MYRYFYSSRLWLRLNAEQRTQLEDALPHVGSRIRPRVQAILLLDGGLSAAEIARTLGVHRNTVYNWIKRFDHDGLEGLRDRPRSGRPPKADAQCRASLM